MNRRLIPFTRLSIVFLLAMVLSGGILTYFSINNISNLKELTEKRILEEQQMLAVRFTASLQENLEALTAGIQHKADKERKIIDTLIDAETLHDYIIQGFLIRDKNIFIFPYFTGINDPSSISELSSQLIGIYHQGEKAEFAGNDLAKAGECYRSCLKLSKGAADSAACLNALGRVSVKSGEVEEATGYYMAIIRNYASLTDRNGFPYAYYALSGLVKNSGARNRDKIIPVIESFMADMERGSVPLNFQSGTLLDLISEWSAENLSQDSISFTHTESRLNCLGKQLWFLNHCGDEIKAIIREGISRKEDHESDWLRIANLFSDSMPQFIAYRETEPYYAGYLIDRNRFFNAVAREKLQGDLEFEYLYDFSADNSLSSTLDKLVYSIHLNPFFPEQVLLIYPQDEDLINDLVKHRAWIYGMATFLLLVAMLLGIILIQRDIARQKNLATLRSDFISNVTHELKTPLTSIRMYAESLMMRRIRSNKDQHKYLSVIVTESERLKRMINNILEFSKMEKARQEVQPVESNLSEIVYSAIQDMSYWLDKEEFTLTKEIEEGIKAKVDPDKLHQVYTNLLNNAIKYSGDSRHISVRLFQNHLSVVTEVEDEGIGIAGEDLSKIFDEFFRVENHGSGNITGTGLGLTVVKEIVEAHHGSIKVESEIGKGSKFSVILYQ